MACLGRPLAGRVTTSLPLTDLFFMSDPIKPKGTSGIPLPDPAREAIDARVPFAKHLDSTAPASNRSLGQADDIRFATLVADLRAGRIDPEATVAQLAERLAQMPGLSMTQRAELERFLRAAITDDPAMEDLMKDLRRGL